MMIDLVFSIGHPPDQAKSLLPRADQPHEESKPLHEEERREGGEEEGELCELCSCTCMCELCELCTL